ncbi:MAG: cyclic nucleotide-binding domain-containing protein [Bacteroidota bacterium]
MANADRSQTQLKREEQYKDRWTSYGGASGIITLSEKPTPTQLKRFDIFQEYDDKFLEKISPDISIATWKNDTVLFEEGSYIDIAFYVVKGSIDVYLQKQQAAGGRPIFDRARTVVVGESESARKPSGGETVFDARVKQQPGSRTAITFLSSMDFNLPTGEIASLKTGDLFGEIGALSGWPQSVTAKTTSECELVQIRVPALRMMRRKSSGLKAKLDAIYRERSLVAQLKATPLFNSCDDEFIRSLGKSVELVSCEPDETITRQGAAADAIYLVRSGFVKLQQRLGEGEIVVSYLSKGMTLGEAELLTGDSGGWLYTASSKEYSELVKIKKDEFLAILKQFPTMEKLLWHSVIARLKEAGSSRRNIGQAEFIDTALTKGLVEGNSILVIDLTTCTRCDDCVRGCAETHGGIPRFVREGEKYGNFLITRSCYHCEDPVCLVGCPTGAIRRADVGDVVEISDPLCIGCQSCANNCPYDAIVMYDTGETWPQDMIPEGLRAKPRQLATKCDQCHTSPQGPSCVNSCPHGCATRIGSIEEFQQSLLRSSV